MTFTAMIGQAGRIWWRRRSLWILGILLALCGRSAYSTTVNFQQSNPFTVQPGMPPDSGALLDQLFPAWLRDNLLPIVLGAVLATLSLWLLGGLLAAWASAAGIHIVAHATDEQPLNLGAAFGRGRAAALRLFALEVLAALPALLLFIIIATILAASLGRLLSDFANSAMTDSENLSQILIGLTGTLFCFIPLLIVAILFSTVLGVLTKIAARACLLEGYGVRTGMGRAWMLVRRSFGSVLALWFLLIILGGLFGMLTSQTIFVVLLGVQETLPPIPGAFDFAQASAVPLGMLVVVSGLFGGILTALNETIWTVAYRWLVAQAGLPPAPPRPYELPR